MSNMDWSKGKIELQKEFAEEKFVKLEDGLNDAIARISAWGAEALVVSLGVDAYKDDPISFFKLESDDHFLQLFVSLVGETFPRTHIHLNSMNRVQKNPGAGPGNGRYS